MSIDNYVTESAALEFKNNKDNLSFERLIEKKSMILTSALLGIFGVDRYILGDKVRGVAKGVTFISLVIATLATLFTITGKVYDEVFKQYFGQSITITWADNVAIVGQGMANLLYSFAGLLAGYIVFAVVDGFLCYYKNLDINYKLLKQQIK